MLFMVIERFRDGDPEPIRRRFLDKGRMMPEGIAYRGSWVDADGARCFQIMEADDAGLLEQWMERWADLIDFEVTRVWTSQDYWARFENPATQS